MRKLRTCALATCLIACTTSRTTEDAGTAPPVDAALVTSPPVDSGGEIANPILGEWERRTEPYKGMRIAIRSLDPIHAVVTAAPPVTPERMSTQPRSTPPAVAKAQLECQRSLWKPGDELLTNARSVGANVVEATILVRDWGFTGICRHADSRAPARLIVSPEGDLTIEVTRGTTVKQHWARIGP